MSSPENGKRPPFDPLIFSTDGGMPRLMAIMRALRDPENGCPWDIEQSFETIAPYTIEEAYEVADAVARDDMEDLKSELGDLLFQVVYFAQMASEENIFQFEDIVKKIAEKMLARHPHVFGDDRREKTAAEQAKDWEDIKAQERKHQGASGVLDGVAKNLPSITRAAKLQKRAAEVGFDWPNTESVLEKLHEEIDELLEAGLDQKKREEEFGDLLFAMINLARHLKIDADRALRYCNEKFTRRFQYIERALAARGEAPQKSSLEEMDALWRAAKAEERA